MLTTAGLCACGRSRSEDSGGGPLRIALDTTRGVTDASIVVTGASDVDLAVLRVAEATSETWDRLLRVTVSDQDSVAVAGRYAVSDSAVEFRPLFALDRGRSYSARFDPARLPTPRPDSVVLATIALPTTNRAPSTTVVRILPTSDVVPENLLRLYVEFSAPMSRGGGLGFVTLLDDARRDVPAAFLPLEADFWNGARTRYTLFLDPGRVKRGIMPNEQLGRAIHAGRSYTVEIGRRWKDAEGLPLAAPYRRTLRVGPPRQAAIDLGDWRVRAPAAGTRHPLVVIFRAPLDHGLLQRALGVRRAGRPVSGDVAIGDEETEWRFAPRDAWRAGVYELIVLSILEDVAGNRIGRPFEVDMFVRVDTSAVPERFTIPFLVK